MKTKSENRKALPKFSLVMVLSGLLGGVIGMLIVSAEGNWTKTVADALHHGLAAAAPWLLVAVDLVSSLGVFLLHRKAKVKWSAMVDPEDEDMLEQVDHTLELALLLNNICSIASYFLLAVTMICLTDMGLEMAVVSLAAFVFALISMIVGQQKLVDFTKKLYPEKRGSVYDMKFAKTWYSTCDEAERAQIGQAAYTAYKTTTITCVVVWMVLVLGAMLFEIGILPVAVVSVIWLVSTVSYSLKSMELGKRK